MKGKEQITNTYGVFPCITKNHPYKFCTIVKFVDEILMVPMIQKYLHNRSVTKFSMKNFLLIGLSVASITYWLLIKNISPYSHSFNVELKLLENSKNQQCINFETKPSFRAMNGNI